MGTVRKNGDLDWVNRRQRSWLLRWITRGK